MSEVYWRAEEAHEEDVINPLARGADRAQMRLEDGFLRRLRTRAEIEIRRRVYEVENS